MGRFSFECGGCGPFSIAAGTSVATPLFGGVVALSDQVAGKSLGQVNDALYSIPYGGGLVDVTEGSNDDPFTNSDGKTYACPGSTRAPATTSRAGSGRSTRPGSSPHSQPRSLQGAAAAAETAECAGALNSPPSRATCTCEGRHVHAPDSAVDGNVNVDPGGTLVLNGVTVGGDVVVASGAAAAAPRPAAHIVAGRVTGQCAGL